jgi:hypothetical protein
MEDSTIQPANQPAKKKNKKKKKKKKKDFATSAAVAAAAAAIITVGISWWQGHVASRSFIVTQQGQIADEKKQLVDLTTAIAGLFAKQANPVNKAKGDYGLSEELTAQLTVAGQAGAEIIDDLNNKGVAGYEDIEVAQALAYSNDKADAITYYSYALKARPHNAVTRATALRYRAFLYYGLNQPTRAHRDMMGAASAFHEHLLETPSYIANAVAQAYAVDAYYQLTSFKDCAIALSDIKAARGALGSYDADSLVQEYMHDDSLWLETQCGRSLLHLP